MLNTYACKGVSNPNVPIFPPRVCTLVLFIANSNCDVMTDFSMFDHETKCFCFIDYNNYFHSSQPKKTHSITQK